MQLEREEIHEQRNKKVAGLLKYFGVIMAFFYMSIGILIFLFPIIEDVSNTLKFSLSAILILYGAFRFYRAIK